MNHRFSHKQTNWGTLKHPIAGVVRYGAYGDAMQAASVCAALKASGHTVILFSTYPAAEVVAHDPNIDRIITQDMDQLNMNWLGLYWQFWKEKCDKWVNLTESVEVNLLTTAGNVRFNEWPPKLRHEMMNRNYVEFQHRIANVPYEKPLIHFYPSAEERQWRTAELAKMRKAGIKKIILLGVAGSARTHKIYPYTKELIQHVLEFYPDWGVVIVGDSGCKIFEEGFEGQPRVWRTAGAWTCRKAFAFIEAADVIVGPETGLMSAACMYPQPKLVFLSHSTVENLTRDWVNTTSMYAPATHCPGRGKNEAPACHFLLPTWEGCRRNDNTGVAQCMSEIKPQWVWHELQSLMNTGQATPDWRPPVETVPDLEGPQEVAQKFLGPGISRAGNIEMALNMRRMTEDHRQEMQSDRPTG